MFAIAGVKIQRKKKSAMRAHHEMVRKADLNLKLQINNRAGNGSAV